MRFIRLPTGCGRVRRWGGWGWGWRGEKSGVMTTVVMETACNCAHRSRPWLTELNNCISCFGFNRGKRSVGLRCRQHFWNNGSTSGSYRFVKVSMHNFYNLRSTTTRRYRNNSFLWSSFKFVWSNNYYSLELFLNNIIYYTVYVVYDNYLNISFTNIK